MATGGLQPALASALIEAFNICTSLLPLGLRPEFVLVSSAALARWGGGRKTEDIDVACSPAARYLFQERASSDSRFYVAPDLHISYTASRGIGAGICIPIDVLVIGDEAVPRLVGAPVAFEGVFVAGLEDLLLMKGRAFVNDREKSGRDFRDFEWILVTLERHALPWNAGVLLTLLSA